MSATDFHDDLLPQDTAEDDSSLEANTSQPLTEAEIEDLLYGGDRSTSERLALLRSLRTDMLARRSNDLGEDDPYVMVREITDRIIELQGADEQSGKSGQLNADPLEHRETLAPDSDELEDLEAQDQRSLDEGDIAWSDDADEPKSP